MLPDTSFRSLFLLTGMTTCGCYSQPEDTEMITSVFGTFETCRPAVTMSAPEGRPEVMGRPANAYLGVFLGVRLIYQCDIITQHGGRPMTVLVAPPQTISFSRECR